MLASLIALISVPLKLKFNLSPEPMKNPLVAVGVVPSKVNLAAAPFDYIDTQPPAILTSSAAADAPAASFTCENNSNLRAI